MALATVDIPISLLEWELFLPEQYSAKPIAGNVIPVRFDKGMPARGCSCSAANGDAAVGHRSGLDRGNHRPRHRSGGRGAPRRDCHAHRRRPAAAGHHRRGRHVPVVGHARWTGECQSRAGGLQVERNVVHLRRRPTPGGYSSRYCRADRDGDSHVRESGVPEQRPEGAESRRRRPPFSRRRRRTSSTCSARLPASCRVRVDVPRAGTAYRFVRPLVLNEETSVSFRYKRR